jgi:uncharacterized membrane protein
MSDGWLHILTLTSALGCGLMAGFFFAFSVSVMKALGGLPPAQGIAAMQSINVVVINAVFMIAFFGTAVVCLVVTIAALRTWDGSGAAYLLAGGLLYLVGSFLVTIVFNVPRNNALAAVEPASDAGAALWASYLTAWTAWNHVRTVAALAAAAALSIALRQY